MSGNVDASMAILAMTQAIGAFTTFLPPLTAIRQGSIDDPGFRSDVRVGEVAAAGLTIGVGGMVASLSGSASPAVVSVVTAAGMIVLYEWTLRTPAGPRPDMSEVGNR